MGITIEGKEKKGEFKLSEAEKKLWEEDDVGITIDDLPGEDSSKRLLVLMIVDATPSMSGQAIGQVNYALQELVSELKMFESENAVNLELAILSFTNSIRWEMKPRNIRDCYDIPQIRVRPGLTQYGVFYHELNKMLNREHLLGYSGKQAAPVLILLTDGSPADEYQDDLRDLRKNGYFMLANRSAVVMGEGAEDPAAHAAAVEFASDESKVLTAGKYSEIVKSIRLATLHTLKNDFPAGEEEDSDPDGGDPSAGENPDEDDPFAKVNPDEDDPFAEVNPTGDDPFAEVNPDSSDPFAEVNPDSGDPFAEVNPDNGDPFAKVNPDSGDPFAKVNPTGDDPFAEVNPAGSDPFAKVNPDSSDPFAEVNPDSGDPFAKGDPGTPFVDIDENDSDIPF